MTSHQFKMLWANRYPASLPISHSFRHDYPERWFRIHSLPESKRYAEEDEDWQILLHRQNSVIAEIIGEHSPILLVTGEYHWEGLTSLDQVEDAASIRRFSFTQLDEIDLYAFRPNEYDKGQTYKPSFCEAVWIKNTFDDVLNDIANDAIRVIFLSVDKDIVVAPYDGGMDLILEDRASRDRYKTKFRDWLSSRSDGL